MLMGTSAAGFLARTLCDPSIGRTHGCTDKQCDVKILLANSEPSTHGTELPDQNVRCPGEYRVQCGPAADVAKSTLVTRKLDLLDATACFGWFMM
jgi:hypothetical protein